MYMDWLAFFITTHCTTPVKSKGAKERIVPLGEVAAIFLQGYLQLIRPWLVSSPEENGIFLNTHNGRRLSKNALSQIG
jgi:site-specific recombinase XerD